MSLELSILCSKLIFQWKFRCNFLAIRASTQVRTWETSCNLESWLHSSTAVSTKNSIPNRSSFFTNLWYVPLFCSFSTFFQTQGSPYARDDITFLKCIRMLMGMSKRRYGKTNLHLVVKPRVFREKEFCHHSNPNYDPFFVTALIVKTSEYFLGDCERNFNVFL